MSGFEMFCERCGTRYGSGEAAAATAALEPRSKRLLRAIGVTTAPPPKVDEPFLRFCLACRGYSCPSCWNEQAGFCQTCLPSPEEVAPAVEPMLPALETPPQIAFDEPAAPAFATASFAVDPLAEPVVDQWAPGAPVDTSASEVPWSTPEVVAASWLAAEVSEPEAEPEPEPVFVAEPERAVPEPLFVAELAPEQELVFVAEPEPAEPEPVFLAEPAPEPEPAPFGMAERPMELVFADEAPGDEADSQPEPAWELAFEPEPEVIVIADTEPVAASAPAPEVTPVFIAEPEPEVAPEPVVVALPEVAPVPESPLSPQPVFKPLPPLGPIYAPPPPMPHASIPRMEFDLPSAPPAYIIAPPQPAQFAQQNTRTLPTGLFDGPGPAIKPCTQCDLPVSAKARFCRRCGSAQEPLS